MCANNLAKVARNSAVAGIKPRELQL